MSKSFAEMGSYLAEKRKKVGISQAELGERVNVHSQFVSNWERGLCAPPSHAMKELVKVLSVHKSEFKRIALRDAEEDINSKVKSIWK